MSVLPCIPIPVKIGTLRYLIGDATEPYGPGPVIIAHICNDIGKWGSGFVMAVSRRWPQPERDYLDWHRDHQHGHGGLLPFALGQVALVQVAEGTWVANMIGQHGIRGPLNRRPLDYDALFACLGRVAELATTLGATVHMPRIGCDRGGGKWGTVELLIRSQLCVGGVDVTIYDLPTANSGSQE